MLNPQELIKSGHEEPYVSVRGHMQMSTRAGFGLYDHWLLYADEVYRTGYVRVELTGPRRPLLTPP